jgi:hypothetical protein
VSPNQVSRCFPEVRPSQEIPPDGVAARHVWPDWRFSSNGVFVMSAQIIKLSDHRRLRPEAMPGLIGLSVSIVVANLFIGVAIYGVVIKVARLGFTRY